MLSNQAFMNQDQARLLITIEWIGRSSHKPNTFFAISVGGGLLTELHRPKNTQ